MTANARFEITAVDKTAAAFAAVQGHLGKLEGTLNSLRNLAFGSLIGAGIAELTHKVYDATVQWQSWQYTLEGAGLSTGETAKQLKFLQDTSEELGLSIKDVGSSFSRFLLTGKAAGMTVQGIDADFKAVSEAMRVFHLSSNQTTRSWLALTEVMSMGTLHSRQFTQQLGRDWPGIGALLAQALYPGEASLKRFMEAMDKGQISSGRFMDAFQKVMAEPAMQGALADAEHSIQAATGRLSTSFFDLFNQADSPALNDMIDSINSLSSTLASPGVKQGFDSIISGLASVAKEAARVVSGLGDIVGLVERLHQNQQRSAEEAELKFRMSEMHRLAAKGLQGSAEYKRDEAFAIGANQFLLGQGGSGAGGSSFRASLAAQYKSQLQSMAAHGQKGSAAYKELENEIRQLQSAGTPSATPGASQDDALHALIFGDGKSAPWMESTRSAIKMPSDPQAAKAIDLKVHFNASQAELELQKLSDDLKKTHKDNITQLFQQDQAAWMKVFSPITDAFDQTIIGVLRGTQTWQMGMKRIFSSIEEDFIDKGVHMAASWAASELAQVAVSQQTGMSKVAIAQMVGKQSAAASLESDSKTILGSAWTAAANVYKSVSAIPFVGWIMAPALAIAAAVEVAGFAKRIASAEGGWWQVPSDQLTNIHKDEMVLPRHLAQPLRENIEGGGAAPSGTEIHVHALDSRSMLEALKRNPQAIAKAVQHAARHHVFA